MIERASITEYDRVMQIWLEANVTAHDFVPRKYWESNFDTVRTAIEQAEVYIYKEADRIQGFIGLTGTYIAGIFVDNKVQSQGIGKKLLNYVKDNHTLLTLSVYTKNQRAVQFYQREQFTIDSEGVDTDTGEQEYHMIWRR